MEEESDGKKEKNKKKKDAPTIQLLPRPANSPIASFNRLDYPISS